MLTPVLKSRRGGLLVVVTVNWTTLVALVQSPSLSAIETVAVPRLVPVVSEILREAPLPPRAILTLAWTPWLSETGAATMMLDAGVIVSPMVKGSVPAEVARVVVTLGIVVLVGGVLM